MAALLLVMAKSKAGRGHKVSQWFGSWKVLYSIGCFQKFSLDKMLQAASGTVCKQAMWTWKGEAFTGKRTASTKTLSTCEQKWRLYFLQTQMSDLCTQVAQKAV